MTAPALKSPSTKVDNGVNVTALLSARESLEKAPKRRSSSGEQAVSG